MKQTAVDWLFTQLWETPRDKFTWQSILKEAKEMEKKQIEDAHLTGASSLYFGTYKSENEYYKETYEEL